MSEVKQNQRTSKVRDGIRRILRLPILPKIKADIPLKFGSDLRNLGPLHTCPCGCTVFNIMATFSQYEISWYMLDGTCANCGNLITVPCPIDDPSRDF